MLAFRSVVSVLLRALGDFSLHLKAGPAGGRLRRPSSAGRPYWDTAEVAEPHLTRPNQTLVSSENHPERVMPACLLACDGCRWHGWCLGAPGTAPVQRIWSCPRCDRCYAWSAARWPHAWRAKRSHDRCNGDCLAPHEAQGRRGSAVSDFSPCETRHTNRPGGPKREWCDGQRSAGPERAAAGSQRVGTYRRPHGRRRRPPQQILSPPQRSQKPRSPSARREEKSWLTGSWRTSRPG